MRAPETRAERTFLAQRCPIVSGTTRAALMADNNLQPESLMNFCPAFPLFILVLMLPLSSPFKNYEGCCFRAKGRMARRDEGEYPLWIFDRGATKPDGSLPENPPGGGSFARGLCCLGRHSPLWGCSGLAALATVKIPRRKRLSANQ